MKNVKMLFICSVFEIIMSVILCVICGFKFIWNTGFQRTAFIAGVVSLVFGVVGLVLSKNPKYRKEAILSETDEREISIKHKSGYISGLFLYFANVLFAIVLHRIDLYNIVSIPIWIMLWPLGMSALYCILYLICFYFMRNKK